MFVRFQRPRSSIYNIGSYALLSKYFPVDAVITCCSSGVYVKCIQEVFDCSASGRKCEVCSAILRTISQKRPVLRVFSCRSDFEIMCKIFKFEHHYA